MQIGDNALEAIILVLQLAQPPKRAGATAAWSLASNVRRHPAVRTILESEWTNYDEQTQELIAAVLIRDPADFAREMSEIIARQRAAGKWK